MFVVSRVPLVVGMAIGILDKLVEGIGALRRNGRSTLLGNRGMTPILIRGGREVGLLDLSILTNNRQGP